jgi:hypothetical protein
MAFTRFYLRYLYFLLRFWYGLTCRLTWKRGPWVHRYVQPLDITRRLAYKTYKTDPLKGKFDFMSHPRKVEAKLEAGKRIGDCDDHAIYWCTALLKSGISQEVYFAIYQAVEGHRRFGHAVCVFRHQGSWFYADYGAPVEIVDKWGYMLKDATRRNADPIGGILLRVESVSNGDTPRFRDAESHVLPQ